MANNKIDRINKEIAKTREKITEYQNKLKGLEAQKPTTELSYWLIRAGNMSTTGWSFRRKNN